MTLFAAPPMELETKNEPDAFADLYEDDDFAKEEDEMQEERQENHAQQNSKKPL